MKSFCANLLIVAAFCGLAAFNEAAIPSYIKVCSRKNVDINNCIIDSINNLRPLLAKGLSDLKVPSIEPFELDALQLHLDSNGGPFNLKELKVWGVSNFNITELKSKIGKSKVHFHFKADIPDLNVTGQYDIDTKLVFIQLKGEGDFAANISKLVIECAMSGNKVQSGASAHIIFDPIICDINIEGLRMYLSNLFKGNEAAEKATNAAINDSSKLFVDEIKGTLGSSLGNKLTTVANQITRSFEYSELFPV